MKFWKEFSVVKRISSLALVAILIFSLPLLSSCAGPTIPSPTESSESPSSPTASPSSTPTVKAEKTIRQTQANAPYIDPAVGSDFSSSTVLCNIYDSLVFPLTDGSIAPLVAKSWEVAEDGLTYTFELEQGIKFHNGDELTADDVVFSMERLLAIGEGYAYLFTTTVSEIKALDDYKVEIKLKQTFGPFLQCLCRLYILNKDQVMANIKSDGPYGEMGDYGKDWLISHDAGSGPYMVKEMKQEEYCLCEKFEDYWGGWDKYPDAPDSFKEIGTTEPVTVRTLMARRELEITDQWQTNEALNALDQMPGIDIATVYPGTVLNITLNTKKPPTDDIHFRKALAYCVDYETICNQLFPGSKPAIGPVSSVTPGHNPDLFQYTQDFAKAEEELKQSKYYGQLDQYPFELHWVSEVPDEEKVALMVQANAAKIGIKVNVVKVPWLSCIDNMAQMETTPNGVVVFVSAHYAEAGSMLESRYHSRSCGTWEQGEWLQDPEIDQMIEDAIATIDQEERFAKYRAIQEKIVEQCPTIFVLDQAQRQAIQSAYVVWPSWEEVKTGRPSHPVMGYDFYFREFKVYPDKVPPPA